MATELGCDLHLSENDPAIREVTWCPQVVAATAPQPDSQKRAAGWTPPPQLCSAASRRSFLCSELERNHISDVGKNLIIGNLCQVLVDFGDDLVTHVRL